MEINNTEVIYCQRCKDESEDLRTLWMACLYDMNELKVPFHEEYLKPLDNIGLQKFFTLRVCKDCRADWMRVIQYWWNTIPQKSESCGSGIYVRDFGTTREVTLEEYREKYQKDKS